MTQRLWTVAPATTLDRAIELMDERALRHLPVVEGETLIGVISDRDLLQATGWLHPRECEALEAPLSQVGDLPMRKVEFCGPDDELGLLLERFVKGRVGSLPVVDGGRLLGIVTVTDILRAYSRAARRGSIRGAVHDRIEPHMTRDPLSVAMDASGDEVAKAMRQAGVRHLLVTNGPALVGIVSDRDVRGAIGRGQLETLLAEDMMTPDPQTAAPGTTLASAALLLTAERISALPVVDGDAVVGVLTTSDLLIPCAIALRDLD